MKQVLYITYDGLTDPLGRSQVLPYLQHLSAQGYRFTILSFEKKERFEREGGRVREITDAAGITWKPLFFTAKPPVLSKIWDRYRMRQTAVALHRKHRFDMTHCRSYVAAEVGLHLKQRFGVKMLFDMRGFWADEKLDNGHWDQRKPLFRYIYYHYKNRERTFLLRSDAIVSLTHAAKDRLLSQPVYKDLSIDVIPCCADLNHFDYNRITKDAAAVRRAGLGIPASAKVLIYLGSVGGWYMTREMFRFFAILQQTQPKYVFLLLTKDNPESIFAEAAEAGIPKEKIFISYATRDELPEYLHGSDCSIFFIRHSFSKIASSPTKHAELMGMGIPVICNDIGDTGHIIRTTGTGILANDFSDATLLAVAHHVPDLEKIDKAAIRAHAHQCFDLQTGAANYGSLYRRLLL